MPNRWTKKLPLLALSAALLLTCCACAAQAEEEKGETAAKTAGTEAYSLTLPATITAKEQENNTHYAVPGRHGGGRCGRHCL